MGLGGSRPLSLKGGDRVLCVNGLRKETGIYTRKSGPWAIYDAGREEKCNGEEIQARGRKTVDANRLCLSYFNSHCFCSYYLSVHAPPSSLILCITALWSKGHLQPLSSVLHFTLSAQFGFSPLAPAGIQGIAGFQQNLNPEKICPCFNFPLPAQPGHGGGIIQM